MSQYTINIGALPNDGTGDPLRTAFNETNLNFNQVFAAGPVLSNIRIANNTILTTTTNGNLVLAPNGVGRIQANASIVPSVANVRDLGSTTQRWNTIYTQYLDISGVLTTGDLTVDGNLTVQGNTIQIGNIVTDTKTIQLANTANSANAANGSGITVGANDNIATLIYNSTGNVWTMNIGVSSVGNISAPYLFGNGSQLTGLPASYSNANVVTLLAGFGSNTISTTGNISGGFIFGNISLANGFPATYANANAVAYGESGWAGNIVPSGNAVYSLGNATNQWNDLYVSNTTIFMNNVPISLSAGNVLTVNGNAVLQNNSNTTISTTGTVTSGNLLTGGVVSATGTVTGGNVLTGGIISATGNITSNGLVSVNRLSINQTANTWFISGNTISAPSGATWTSDYVNRDEYITSARDGYINLQSLYANSNVASQVHLEHGLAQIVVDNGSEYIWAFDDAGNLTLPRGGIVYETSIPFGSLTGNTIALKPQGGIDADQQLLIYPTVIPGTDDNHLHLTTGNLYNTELFLGNDNLYVKLANTGNVVINSNDDVGNSAQWTFGANGNLTLPGGSKIFDTPTGVLISGAGQTAVNRFYTKLSNTLYEAVDAGVTYRLIDQGLWSLDVVGEDNPRYTSTDLITWTNTGGGLPAPTGTLINGLANVTVGGNTWTFGATGNLSAPGNVSAVGNITGGNILTGGLISATSSITSAANITGGNVLTGGLISATSTITSAANITGGNILTAGIVSATGNVSGNFFIGNGSQLTGIAASYGNANVATFLAAYGSNTISTSGNVTAGNIIGNISITGNVQGTTANVTLVAGSYNWTFDNTGNLTLPGNTFSVNYANNTPVDAVTRFEGTWTVPVGNSTQSFTVTGNNSYQMWVEGNIPNGIIVWNATGTVTNTNVPVIGQQFAWNYEGGGNILMFTSIPAQIIGTAGAIANAQPAVANTNVFSFGINNTSGGNVTVRYGWIQIS